ncbi:hypothetical protein ACFQMA_15280 [Halosimplex aquaticum]|uniref:Uncharacterized protein n=1 Tax=Halosimplex aquaticum TaxID=3026162 RepID=A0ABD5Y4E3_9EURY|nr:hypothetical protein [Halosimplex aquaticum]
MAPALHATPLRAAAMAFVAGVLAVTAFGIVVAGDSPERAALGSLGYAVGGAIGVYIAYAAPGVDL